MSFLPHLAGINYVPGPNTTTDLPRSATAPTAQTSGFVQAGDAPQSQQLGTSDGPGLGSSPLVPKPGTSTDAQTGKIHSEGITLEELQAKRAAEAAAVTAQLSSSTSAELNDQVSLPSGGGGLGSSPLVPEPGTSINAETGQLHSEGISKAELQARKAAEQAALSANVSSATSAKPKEISQDELKQIQEKGKELLDPTPHHQQARRGSTSDPPASDLPGHSTALTADGRRLSDLSGREQAARQLAGNAIPSHPFNQRKDSGLSTPGQELPGGWGSTQTVPLPGTAPNAPTSLYHDIAEGLDSVGRAAFNVIPTPIKDAFSASPTSPKSSSAQLGVSTPQGRRSSVTALFDQAKDKASRLVEDAQGTLQNTQRRASASLNRDSELRTKISGFVDNFAAASPAFVAAGPGRQIPVAIVPRYSLPSEEPAGARRGEHTSGAGALPGSSNERGVAVLPDEKKAPLTLPSQENQGVLPGETSGGIGALPGQIGESGVAVLPDERATNGYQELKPASSAAGPSGTSGLAGPFGTTSNDFPTASGSAGPSGTTTESTPRGASSGSSYAGLAPALPSTSLGLGGDKGATDVPATLGTSSSNANSLTTAPEPTSTVESGSTPATSTLSPATATTAPASIESSDGVSSALAVPETRHANERTSSAASVTAIRHGHEGSVSKISPLAGDGITVPEHEELDTTSTSAGVGQKSTTPGTGPSHTTSLTPGNEHEGIGHPSTRGSEGTERKPGSYPTVAGGDDKLQEEKKKAEAIVDAPAQESDLTKEKVNTETPANGPTQKAVNDATSTEKPVEHTTAATTPSKDSSVPHPTSVEEAKDIAGVNGASPATPTSKSTTTPSSPSTKTTPTTAAATGNGTGKTSGDGHSRKGSTSSEKKRGLFGKIKDKLKH
ncbi:hypothetical protein L486_00749 [Kwoniella mangroviensis CBS 10435]|uniref:Uncharacterized protein n=1 Tax=Kwoniella mangroviensis CBS 10435 TaxID=1331196 RepID=A0A1B9IZZ0_9TREE|nr:hypothetical protein L486_00749 [Kwoniella mangroviensis CBS 10435]